MAAFYFWIEDTEKWKPKTDIHTFFPSKWDINKIKKVVQEASENITFSDGRKFQGISKEGIEIEFYIDRNTREIKTA